MKNKLEWTGERMVEIPALAKGIVEHLHRYALCLDYVEGKVVLDIACGEGYGSNLLAGKAELVYGFDIAESVVVHASASYVKKNLKFDVASVLKIPLNDNSIDVAISFETLEHLTEQEEMVTELKRVLKYDGLLIISTPEKENYHEIDPNNPYHLKELTLEEFEILMTKNFNQVKVVKQRFIFSSQIYDETQSFKNLSEFSGSFETIKKSKFIGGHYFNIAFCTNNTRKIEFNSSIFNGNKQFNEYEKVSWMPNDNENAEIILKKVLNSMTYKVGKFFLFPFSYIKGKL